MEKTFSAPHNVFFSCLSENNSGEVPFDWSEWEKSFRWLMWFIGRFISSMSGAWYITGGYMAWEYETCPWRPSLKRILVKVQDSDCFIDAWVLCVWRLKLDGMYMWISIHTLTHSRNAHTKKQSGGLCEALVQLNLCKMGCFIMKLESGINVGNRCDIRFTYCWFFHNTNSVGVCER